MKYGMELKRYWSGSHELADIKAEHNNNRRL
ncbi:hypothetical protein KO116_03901 [Halomonas sp. KO116]|nr:hypothetical protein KO116_03901 [Halomonas sp. KO116]